MLIVVGSVYRSGFAAQAMAFGMTPDADQQSKKGSVANLAEFNSRDMILVLLNRLPPTVCNSSNGSSSVYFMLQSLCIHIPDYQHIVTSTALVRLRTCRLI